MPDVNILVYAHRADEARQKAYAKWLATLIDRGQPFALSMLVAVGFLRIVTNPRIYKAPTPLPVALAAIEQIAGHPHCRLVAPGSEHLRQVVELCRAVSATGPRIADAQHAALAMAEGCTFVTRDADFACFATHGLSWEHLEL